MDVISPVMRWLWNPKYFKTKTFFLLRTITYMCSRRKILCWVIIETRPFCLHSVVVAWWRCAAVLEMRACGVWALSLVWRQTLVELCVSYRYIAAHSFCVLPYYLFIIVLLFGVYFANIAFSCAHCGVDLRYLYTCLGPIGGGMWQWCAVGFSGGWRCRAARDECASVPSRSLGSFVTHSTGLD